MSKSEDKCNFCSESLSRKKYVNREGYELCKMCYEEDKFYKFEEEELELWKNLSLENQDYSESLD